MYYIFFNEIAEKHCAPVGTYFKIIQVIPTDEVMNKPSYYYLVFPDGLMSGTCDVVAENTKMYSRM